MLLSTIIPYLCLAANGLAAVLPETNADRFKRGLTPKQPARRWDATRTHWHHARASGSPSANAYLEVIDSGGNPIGYLYKTNGAYGVTPGYPDAASVFAISADYTDNYNSVKDGSTYLSIQPSYVPSSSVRIADGTNFGTLSYESEADGGQSEAAAFLEEDQYETSVWPIPDGVVGGPNFRPSFTTALAKPMSNAERLKRSLPPNAPARRWSPSRTHFHHARASGSPATTAYIEAYDSNGDPIGYLYKVDSNFYGITTAQSTPATLFSVPNGYTGPYNDIQDGSTYVAIAVQNLPGSSNPMSTGANYGILGFASTSDGGQAEAAAFVASHYYETSIVSVPDDLYGDLEISFTDTDGTVSVLNAYYHAASPDIYLAVNTNSMGGGWSETDDKITLKWVSAATPIGR